MDWNELPTWAFGLLLVSPPFITGWLIFKFIRFMSKNGNEAWLRQMRADWVRGASVIFTFAMTSRVGDPGDRRPVQCHRIEIARQ